MAKVGLDGINTVRRKLASGTVAVYYYHRATGRKLPGKPSSPEFVAAYHAAAVSISSTDRHVGTLQRAIQDYLQSSDFTGLRASTQTDYRKHIAKVEAKFGTLPLIALNDPAVRGTFLKWRDGLAVRSKRQADAAMVMLGTIIAWAMDAGEYRILYNRAARPGRLYKSARADIIWTVGDIDRFNAVASPALRLLLLIAVDTGQREGDLLALTWTAWDGSHVSLKQSKGGKHVRVMATAELRAALNGATRASTSLLTDDQGRPWTLSRFNKAWRAATLDAGLDGLHFHDLRGTFVTRAADAGASVAQIATITGHSLKDCQTILDAYMARTGNRGDATIHRMDSHKRTAAAKRLQNANRANPKGTS